MPLISIENINGSKLGIWQKSETVGQLFDAFHPDDYDARQYETLRNERRQTEWLTSRLLLQLMTGSYPTIRYMPTGKPFLPDRACHLSISHSNSMVAVMTSGHNLGIDIEQIGSRATKVRSKFLTGDELQWCHSDFEHTLVWTVKESAYKIYGSGLEHTQVEVRSRPAESGTTGYLKVNIGAPDAKEFVCNYRVVENNILTYIIDY